VLDRLTTPEGSLALAIAALLLVLGYRMLRPERAAAWVAFAGYAAALVVSLLGARGALGTAVEPAAPVRIGGAALLVLGLLVGARRSRPGRERHRAPDAAPAGSDAPPVPSGAARTPSGALPTRSGGLPAPHGVASRARPELGLALVLAGHLARAPSAAGAVAVGVAVALLAWTGMRRGAMERGGRGGG
jgi:MYXO-CTERM domain-containing protein